METDEDWSKFLQASLVCLQDEKYKEGKMFARQLYESAKFHKDDIDTTIRIYKECLGLAQMWYEDMFLATLCFYRVRILTSYKMDPSELWNRCLHDPDTTLPVKIKLIRDVQNIIDEYHEVEHPLVNMMDLKISYDILLKLYRNCQPELEIIKQEKVKHHVHCGWKLYKLGMFEILCQLCKNLEAYNEYEPDQVLILDLWAHTLEQMNKFDIALKKAEDALLIKQVKHATTSIQSLKNRMEQALMNERALKEKVDENWLSGTSVLSPDAMRQKAEKVKQHHYSRTRKKQKRKEKNAENEDCSESSLSEKLTDISDIHITEDENNHNNNNEHSESVSGDFYRELVEVDKIRSWKDVTDFYFPISNKRKRKRHRTGESDQSSVSKANTISDQNSEANSSDILSDMQVVELSDTEDEFMPLPTPPSSEYDCSETIFSEESLDSDEDLTEEQSYFEESCEFYNTNGERMSHNSHQSVLHGLDLSDRFVSSFSSWGRKSPDTYSPFLTKEEAVKRCKQKPRIYKHCKLRIDNSHGATCTNLDSSDSVTTIAISGRSKCGKTFDDDEVIVEILNLPDHDKNYIPRLDKHLDTSMKKENTPLYGKVVCVMKRNRFEHVNNPVLICTLDELEIHLMKPLCKTVPKIHVLNTNCTTNFQVEIYSYDKNVRDLKFKTVKTIDPANRRGYVFIVCMITWNSLYPIGAILEVYSFSDNIERGIEMLRLQHQVPKFYNRKTIQQTTNVVYNGEITDGDKRLDLSETRVAFTIDPAGSKDLDDAISIYEIEDNIYEIGVHIADVASVVKVNDDVDLEAQERSVTFYPGGGYRAHHMLPEPISTDICSLIPDQKRQTISVLFTMNEHGKELKTPVVRKTFIKSKRQFTYEEAQTIITNQNVAEPLGNALCLLAKIAKELRYKRIGRKMFAFPFETNLIENEQLYFASKDAHDLIEEFMVKTNHYIAGFLSRRTPTCIPLRIQKPPSVETINEWQKAYPAIGNFVLALQHLPLPNKQNISIDSESVKKLRWNNFLPIQKHIWSKLIDEMNNENYNEVHHLIGCDEAHPDQAMAYEAWIEFQESAEYKCSGFAKQNETGHFSLGICPYVHFTSPLRRYADLLVHRLVHSVMEGNSTSPYTKEEVEHICQRINEVSHRAKSFQKQCQILHWGKVLNKKPVVLHAMVKKVSEKDITVHLPGMRSLPQQCKEIPLHLLSVTTKPELKDDEKSKQFLTLRWQHRLYSFTGYAPKTRFHKSLCTRVDPHQRVTFQQQKKWRDILKTVIDKHCNDLKSVIFNPDYPDVNMSQSIPACFSAEADVSSEARDGNIVNQCCNFSMSFSHGQILAIQLSAEPRRGVFVPNIQMLDMTNNVKFCLQHTCDPVKFLSSYATRRFDPSTKDIGEYIHSWLSIYRMESAVKMTQGTSLVINDLPIDFTSSSVSDGHLTLRKSFCRKRDLDLGCISANLILYGEEKSGEDEVVESEFLLSSDSLCIRCEFFQGKPLPHGTHTKSDFSPNDRMVWIGHGSVVCIQKGKKNGKFKLHFKLHKESSKPTPEMTASIHPPTCSVEILQKSDSDKRVEAALSCLSKASKLAKAIAVGKKIPKLDTAHLDLSQKIEADVTICGLAANNTQQLKAIRKALKSSFSLIQGPPGTGKTYTGIKLLYLFAKINDILRKEGAEHKQVVFCGPSNKSVDLVARWLQRKLGVHAPKFVRMYGSSLENINYKVPGRDYSYKVSNRGSKPDTALKDVSLHHLIRMEGKPYAEELIAYDKMFEVDPSFSNHEEINKYQKLLSKATQDELKLYDVIFCTTAVATNAKFLKATKGKIYQLIIDEAGMCTEPETLAPIIATSAKQVVLIGDHKQLQPVVLCSDAASLGLNKSLFERFAQQAVFLNCQYRMHPRICDFPSLHFYKGKLETMPSKAWQTNRVLSIWRNTNIPHVFCHVEGDEECLSVRTEEGNQQSKSNKAEVEHVVRIFSRLVKFEGVKPEHINIISQYNAQCFAIRKALDEKKFINYNVNSVVASQGGEWDYIIFSTVRSLPEYRIEPKPTLGWCKQNLGFITDQHQINVALTRARKGLIIIGNKNLMKCDSVWKELLMHYERQGCVEEAENFPEAIRKRKKKMKEATEEEFNSNF